MRGHRAKHHQFRCVGFAFVTGVGTIELMLTGTPIRARFGAEGGLVMGVSGG